jgi:tetratricopeptide (TPR) repeat protein
VAAGDFAAAQAWLDGLLAADPASLPGRMMQAGLWATRGETAEAEALYRALIAETPALPQPHRALYALLASQGRVDDAEAALAAALPATGNDADLMFLQAGLLEARGDVDGAIAVYEALYARDSANPLLANNLASLLTTHRDDPTSLDRAFAIARRLQNSDVPHFQDTFGWILHRRGDSAGALAFLEPAAAALPDNPLVQFHLGEALHAQGRTAEARARFQRTVDLAAGADPAPPQAAAARARLDAIDAAAPIEAAEGSATDG